MISAGAVGDGFEGVAKARMRESTSLQFRESFADGPHTKSVSVIV